MKRLFIGRLNRKYFCKGFFAILFIAILIGGIIAIAISLLPNPSSNPPIVKINMTSTEAEDLGLATYGDDVAVPVPPPETLPANFNFSNPSDPLSSASNDSTSVLFGAFGMLTFILYYIFFICLSLSLFIRRWHDLGESGWYVIFNYIPFINIFVLLYLFFGKGQDTANRFGSPPDKSFLTFKEILFNSSHKKTSTGSP